MNVSTTGQLADGTNVARWIYDVAGTIYVPAFIFIKNHVDINYTGTSLS